MTVEEKQPEVKQEAKEALKLTLNIIRRKREENDLSITFKVSPENNAYFSDALTKIIRNAPGINHIDIKEVQDSETKKSTKMIMDLHGDQQVISRFFQQCAGSLKQYCEEVS